jgi:hypothetical protein
MLRLPGLYTNSYRDLSWSSILDFNAAIKSPVQDHKKNSLPSRFLVISANVALLFLVTIEPFLYNALFINIYNEMVESISVLYAFDIAGMFLILAFFSHVIFNKREVIDENELWRFKFRRATFFAVAAIFVISCFPIFLVVEATHINYSGRFYHIPPHTF